MQNLVKTCTQCGNNLPPGTPRCPECGGMRFVDPLKVNANILRIDRRAADIVKTLFKACGLNTKFIDCTPKKRKKKK
jgi:hypothetical protein